VRDANSFMLAFYGMLLNVLGVLMYVFAWPFSLVFYFPCLLLGTGCGIAGLVMSAFIKSWKVQLGVVACSAISVAILCISERLPA
jgi:hypothetical protein